MDLEAPITSVIPGVSGVILQALANTEQPLTGGQIAGLVKRHASRAGVTKALKHLVESGLLECTPAGRANLYRLNRQHLAADAIISLASLRGALIHRIAHLVEGWVLTPVSVWMYGSAARGGGDVRSDIDVLIVRPDVAEVDDSVWTTQAMELAIYVKAWTGNSCELLELTRGELQRLGAERDPLVASLRRDAVVISGASVTQLLDLG